MIGALTWVVIILAPINPQCDDKEYAQANPGQCQIDSGPFPNFPSVGGHPGGGLIGSILHHLGGLL